MQGIIKSKRGVVEIQLNWIFVLIAGAVILLFFVSLVIKQKSVSESEISYNILTKLKSMTATIGVSPETTTYTIDIPKTEIKWDCSAKTLTIGGAPPVSIPTQVFFAPNLIKGRKLIIWTQEWRVPFFVTNFLFVTSPEVRYVLVYNDTRDKREAELINKTLPEEMNIEIVDEYEFKEELDDKNNYAVKVVFLGFSFEGPLSDEEGDEDEIKSMLKESNIKNIVSGVQYDNNDLFFYEPPDFDWKETKYIKSYDHLKKDPSYYAAIFADSKESYDCMMKTAFRRFDKIKKIYGKRTKRLSIESRKDCGDYYTNKIPETGMDVQEHIANLANDCSEKFPDCETDFGVDGSMIFSVNEGLIRRSCPLIY